MSSLDLCRLDRNSREQGEGYYALVASTNHGWTADTMGHWWTFGYTYSSYGVQLAILNIGIHIFATLG